MTRADLEDAAAEKYPDTYFDGVTRRDDPTAKRERAAYIRGRLDQAEADARLILGTPGGSWEGNRFAAAIRKGVE